jgi:hypothetical protein
MHRDKDHTPTLGTHFLLGMKQSYDGGKSAIQVHVEIMAAGSVA